MTELHVRDVSEFELIRRLQDALPDGARSGAALEIPIGDDAAAFRLTAGELAVVTTDTLNDGVHFRTDWTSWEDLGHKALAVNISDIGAMGAYPLVATVSLALTGNELVIDLVRMYAGMGACAIANRCLISGGDITRTMGPLSISVTAIGETRDGRLLRRDAAQPGDLIWVTGAIAAAAAGLSLELLPADDPRKHATTSATLVNALHHPLPRPVAGQRLSSIGVRCAMDLSDGLTGDLHKILTASNVDAEIRLTDIPVPAAVRALFGSQALDMALYGGDDYELLFTAPATLSSSILEGLQRIGLNATVIGRITPRSGEEVSITGIDEAGKSVSIVPRGFDHFGQ